MDERTTRQMLLLKDAGFEPHQLPSDGGPGDEGRALGPAPTPQGVESAFGAAASAGDGTNSTAAEPVALPSAPPSRVSLNAVVARDEPPPCGSGTADESSYRR